MKKEWELYYEYLMYGISSIIFFMVLWLALPLGIYAIILGIKSYRLRGSSMKGLYSIFLGLIGLLVSTGYFSLQMLPDILREGRVWVYWFYPF